MILDKEVEIKIGTRNKKYYSDLGYNVISIGQKIVINTEHLQSGCTEQINCRCDICGDEKDIRYNAYIINTKSFTEEYCCSNKCAVEKYKNSMLKKYGVKSQFQLDSVKEKCKIVLTKFRNEMTEDEKQKILNKTKQTNLKIYGYENVFQNEEIKEKRKETMIERYGVEHTLQSDGLKDKVKQVMLKKHGVEHAQQNKNIHEKSKTTMLKNYGVEYALQNKKIKKKSRQTCLEKYGTGYVFQLENVKEKSRQTWFDNYGVYHPAQDPEIFKRIQQSSFKIKQFKNTDLTYQGSYELYFLESIDNIGLLHLVLKGNSYEYILNDKFHVYHSDFIFNGNVIEIKSMWTYNKNGTDLELELKNETKWQTVRNYGNKITVLFSKKEIKEYVENLNQLFIKNIS